MCNLILIMQGLVIGVLWFMGGNMAYGYNLDKNPDKVDSGAAGRTLFILLYPFHAVLQYTRLSLRRLRANYWLSKGK
jgi:hypothetical protein